MRAVLQKVSSASVSVVGSVCGHIGPGYLVLACAMEGDGEDDCRILAEKIVGLRLWEGEGGKVNDRSILDVNGGILVVSQFTLAGDTRKGRRPDYTAAAKPDVAGTLLERFAAVLKEQGISDVQQGAFGAHMEVALVNDGPVTLMFDTRA